MVAFGPASNAPSATSNSIFHSLIDSSKLTVRPLPIDDPFECYQALRPHFDQSFILESAPGPERLAEYTFLGFGPQSLIYLDNDKIYEDDQAVGEGKVFLNYLRKILARHKLLEFSEIKYLGGLVGYVGYDFISYVESVPKPDRPHVFPDVELGLYLDGIVFDHRVNQAFYFSHDEDRSDHFLKLLESDQVEQTPFACESFRCDTEQSEFEAAVLQAKEAIRQGEAYQIVLSRQLEGQFTGDPLQAYRKLRTLNPSPYMYYLDFKERAIAGSSPEMLVSVQGKTVSTYPIAGTRPLGKTEEERQQLAEDLLSDEKEIAEHIMLVDLARNDVGRVADIGSVNVSQFMEIEGFSHVQHIVSCVQGTLREDCDGIDALTSIYPAGTVSGAPKVRAMEIINALEKPPRGPYAGVVGYFSLNGNIDTAIAIRTAFFSGDKIFLQAGAGIVADSVPENEFHETEHKLGPMREVFTISEGES